MEDRDPIKQLQRLLDDPGKVLERISRIQSALGSIHPPSSTAAPDTPVASLPPTETVAILKVADRPYDNLLQMLRDMQAQIEECIRPLALLTVQAEVERLREQVRQERTALEKCAERIDRSLESCLHRIDDSRSIYADLIALTGRLAELGAATEPLPEFSTSQDPSEIIQSRIERLREKGKI